VFILSILSKGLLDVSSTGTGSSMIAKETATSEEIAARVAEAGKRAGAEADARRAQEKPRPLPPERGGPKGPEPTRYGDWEKKGLISDF
jgi:hypothetical protein